MGQGIKSIHYVLPSHNHLRYLQPSKTKVFLQKGEHQDAIIVIILNEMRFIFKYSPEIVLARRVITKRLNKVMRYSSNRSSPKPENQSNIDHNLHEHEIDDFFKILPT